MDKGGTDSAAKQLQVTSDSGATVEIIVLFSNTRELPKILQPENKKHSTISAAVTLFLKSH